MAKFWSAEYTVTKRDVKLQVYRRCREQPARGKNPRVLFLVHGSSFGAMAGYDLQVPGKAGYSMLDTCASFGFDVWTMDHEGYGRSSRTASFSDIPSGAEDLAIAAQLIEKETGVRKAAYYGQSSGSLRAALFAQQHPQHVERLVLDAFVWTGEGSRTLAKRKEGLQSYLASNMRKVSRESLHAALLRDDPEHITVERGVPDALADAALKDGDAVPSGTFVDMCSKLPLVDPAKIDCPVYIMRGEHDGIATLDDILNFYKALPNGDKHFSVMANSAHIAPLGVNRQRFYHLLRWFLELPGAG
ncbi:MAG TPA: alpha/beta fold hydrolase [Woeseiaceae bacterium]|nr:alpha/beta fold hydrolase [Woeseiaceae bacterium]